MASSRRALSHLLLRRAPFLEEAVCRLTSLDTVCKVSAVAPPEVPSVAPPQVPSIVCDLPSPTSVMAFVQEQYDMYDPDASYPEPAESLNTLVPLHIRGFAGDSSSPEVSPIARCLAAFGSRMLNDKPSISEIAIAPQFSKSLAACSAAYLPPPMSVNLSAIDESAAISSVVAVRADQDVPRMANAVQIPRVSVLPARFYIKTAIYNLQPRGRIQLFSPIARPHFGCRNLSTAQDKGGISTFEDFGKLYEDDRVEVVNALDHIAKELGLMKKDLDTVKGKTNHQPDSFKRWMGDRFGLSDQQVESIHVACTIGGYAIRFLTVGSIVYFGMVTVRENDVPVVDYYYLANCVRVQALHKGIELYKEKKVEKERKEMLKAVEAAALKKVADEAVAEKKAKVAADVALRSAKVQQACAVRRSKLDQAGALRKAKAKEAQAARFAEWKQANTARKEAALVRKAEIELAAAARKAKADQAAAARKAKANQQAAAAAADRKAKAEKKAAAAAAWKAK
ncbi:hypothetical protein ZWY2020_004479, partial [Hordeum vulgare]